MRIDTREIRLNFRRDSSMLSVRRSKGEIEW
jgi:hypothetical protein